MRFFAFLLRVVRRERWPTREERERIRERIAEAGSVRAWLKAATPNPDDVRAHKAKLNALAEKCGMAHPYPEIDEPDAK